MFVATCDADAVGEGPCEWSEISNFENETRVLSVLHVIEKHPEFYRRTTGKDPDRMKFDYRDYFNAYKGRY